MDIRNPVLAILCGGAPAPGINGVISSMTIEALNSNCSVLGFFEGFKQLKQGKSMAMGIEFADVTRIHGTGGSMLRTSKQQLQNATHVDNCLRVLQHHRVRYLATIGGTQTAYSASLVAAAAATAKYPLSVILIPKTIFNDMPLEQGTRTFGFSTAREVGAQLVHNFANDARTMLRWYILVCMGQKAGHLCMGIGKAGASTVTIIAEDYLHRPQSNPLTFQELATVLEGAVYKRLAMNKQYGVACIAEGLVSCLDPAEMIERFGDQDTAHSELGRHLCIELQKRFAKRGIDQTVVARNIGAELRSAPPNASDMTLTRDLGFAATRVLMEGGSSCLVTLKGGSIHTIPFSCVLDPAHASTQIRLVDTTSLSYQVAQSYSIMLRSPDLADTGFLQKLARAANMTASEFLLAFQGVASAMPTYRQPQVAGINYSYMSHAFPQGGAGATAASAVAASSSGSAAAALAAKQHALQQQQQPPQLGPPLASSPLTSSGAISPQTQQQLLSPYPAAQAIVQPANAGPSRKSSDREAFSASPPATTMMQTQVNAAIAAQFGTGGGSGSGVPPTLSLPPRGAHSQSTGGGPAQPASSGGGGGGDGILVVGSGTGGGSAVTQQQSWFQSNQSYPSLQRQSMMAGSVSSPAPPAMINAGAETPAPGSVAMPGGRAGPALTFPSPAAAAMVGLPPSGALASGSKAPGVTSPVSVTDENGKQEHLEYKGV